MAKKKEAKKPMIAVVGLEGYGLYYGQIVSFDAKERVVVIRNCRHVHRWYGGTGGITSLAAWGPCGERAQQSRIGAPDPSSTLTRVAAIHECSPEAVANFALIKATR
jgi:hypothetical protein